MPSLNLGCGPDIREGFVNFDVDKDCVNKDDLKPMRIDICGNCEEGLPFKDNTFSKVIASHILEHIHDLRSLKHELWRVMKPDAELVVTVPDYTSPDAWGDDTHCRAFSVQSFFLDFWPGFMVLNVHDQFMQKGNGQKVTWLVAHIKKEELNEQRSLGVHCSSLPSNAVEAHKHLMRINNPERKDV